MQKAIVLGLATSIILSGCGESPSAPLDPEGEPHVAAVSQTPMQLGSTEYPYYPDAAWTSGGVLKFTDDSGNQWEWTRYGTPTQPSEVEYIKNGVYMGSQSFTWDSATDIATVGSTDALDLGSVSGVWDTGTIDDSSIDGLCGEGESRDCCDGLDEGFGGDDGPGDGCDSELLMLQSFGLAYSAFGDGPNCSVEWDRVVEGFEDVVISGGLPVAAGVGTGVVVGIITKSPGIALKAAGAATAAVGAGTAAIYYEDLTDFLDDVLDWAQCELN